MTTTAAGAAGIDFQHVPVNWAMHRNHRARRRPLDESAAVLAATDRLARSLAARLPRLMALWTDKMTTQHDCTFVDSLSAFIAQLATVETHLEVELITLRTTDRNRRTTGSLRLMGALHLSLEDDLSADEKRCVYDLVARRNSAFDTIVDERREQSSMWLSHFRYNAQFAAAFPRERLLTALFDGVLVAACRVGKFNFMHDILLVAFARAHAAVSGGGGGGSTESLFQWVAGTKFQLHAMYPAFQRVAFT